MYAIATLVMGGDTYINAAIALAKSCVPYISGRELELVCMVTDDVTEYRRLYPYYHHVVHVDKIHVGNLPPLCGSARKIYTWVSDVCTKWNVLGLTAYEKVLFLDADMLVVQDIYDLFSLHTPAGSFDHPCSKQYVSDSRWTGKRSKGHGFTNWYNTFSQLYGQQLVHGSIVPPMSIDNLIAHSNSQFALQGGIALLSPDDGLLQEYKRDLPDIVSSLSMRDKSTTDIRYIHTSKTLSGIDELSILVFFHRRGCKWTHIDHAYDVAAFHTYNIVGENTRIIHYMGVFKPWRDGERDFLAIKAKYSTHGAYRLHHHLVEKWWDVYNSDISIK